MSLYFRVWSGISSSHPLFVIFSFIYGNSKSSVVTKTLLEKSHCFCAKAKLLEGFSDDKRKRYFGTVRYPKHLAFTTAAGPVQHTTGFQIVAARDPHQLLEAQLKTCWIWIFCDYFRVSPTVVYKSKAKYYSFKENLSKRKQEVLSSYIIYLFFPRQLKIRGRYDYLVASLYVTCIIFLQNTTF